MIFVLIACLLFILPFLRCFIFNLHKIGYYGIKDIYNYFKYKKWKIWQGYGLNIYVGMFGKGKTLSAANYVISQAKRYNLHVLSNIKLFDIPYEPLLNYQQIIESPENTIILIDEVSTLFNARSWKDFNINLLFQILQCRKNKKQLVCTAQRFAHVDKLLRDITTYVIDCNKYWRFLSNTYYDAWDYENMSNAAMIRHVGKEWNFVADKWYANYDTSELIDNVKKTDFLSNEEIINLRGVTEFNALGVKKPKKKLKKYMKK
ncbi:zonular occludens toxin domain-containing protein [Anaerocolumna sp.]|uniref:zonular occludens toxin domain-containing protein n=1 Tax=Anaerocolumna sp. TaxID=2041569 RepID=UPI0028A8D567|nr:zonular occludens toxin domain-containing protein [Anaerocolumna sp.]